MQAAINIYEKLIQALGKPPIQLFCWSRFSDELCLFCQLDHKVCTSNRKKQIVIRLVNFSFFNMFEVPLNGLCWGCQRCYEEKAAVH